jgi:adenosylmethionine-8-amino-7-oxononanoate aminotransferase
MPSSLTERDQQVIWHPYTQHKNSIAPVAVTRGEGALLFDEKGKTYIDAVSSWWVNIHGHAHPYIAEKIYEQAKKLQQVIFSGFTHEPAVELAERILKILPGSFSKIFYSDNGSTAVEVAVKMAIQYWRNEAGNMKPDRTNASDLRPQTSNLRTKILAFNHSYHGDTFGAMSISDRSVFTAAFQDYLFEVIFIDTPSAENIHELKATVDQYAHEIACFIYEPLLQGAGGMRMYEASLLDELLNRVQSNNIICIADEVLTGFGRTGKLFASEYSMSKPDIICLSKGLTGGSMALGITACSQKIFEAFLSDDRLKTFFHGHSFTANPLACSAALASLDLLEKEECLRCIENISRHNKNFIGHLSERQGTQIKNARQLGTIAAFELVDGKDTYLNAISTSITKKSLESGIYLRPLGNTVYIMPPYCITEEQLNKIYRFLLDLLNEYQSTS